MIEIGPEHQLSYRKEILEPLFKKIKSAESSTVVGAASVGKTRLLDFLTRADVRQHYLQEANADMLLLRVDCNRMHELSDWGFFELLLMVISQSCSQNPRAAKLRPQILDLQEQVITEKNSLMALRFFELTVHMLCVENGFNLCFLLDEFDEVYQRLPKNTLANLRATRDTNKNQLSYQLFLRNLPERLRPPNDSEGFYELFSRSTLGLGPYNEQDSRVILQQWEARRGYLLTPQQKEWVFAAGCGHPGIMQACFGVLQESAVPGLTPPINADLLQEMNVDEECRKLWEGLLPIERQALIDLYHGEQPEPDGKRLLTLKKLIYSSSNGWTAFSPVFGLYIEQVILPNQPQVKKQVVVERPTRTVYIAGRPIANLSKLSFELLDFLEQHCNEVVPREAILERLYGEATEGLSDSRLDNLVSRVRQEIEPDPQNPRYLLTQFGVGFRLHCD